MEKIPLEIVIPIYNEGDKVIKLLDQFQTFIKTKKDVCLEKTQGKYNLIVPNMHPFDAINFIAKN